MFNAVAGDLIELTVDIKNRDNAAVVLDGSTFVFTGVTTDGLTEVTYDESNGIELSGSVVGRLFVSIQPDVTSSFTRPQNIWWDIRMTDVLTEPRTVASGKIAVSLPVSAMVI